MTKRHKRNYSKRQFKKKKRINKQTSQDNKTISKVPEIIKDVFGIISPLIPYSLLLSSSLKFYIFDYKLKISFILILIICFLLFRIIKRKATKVIFFGILALSILDVIVIFINPYPNKSPVTICIYDNSNGYCSDNKDVENYKTLFQKQFIGENDILFANESPAVKYTYLYPAFFNLPTAYVKSFSRNKIVKKTTSNIKNIISIFIFINNGNIEECIYKLNPNAFEKTVHEYHLEEENIQQILNNIIANENDKNRKINCLTKMLLLDINMRTYKNLNRQFKDLYLEKIIQQLELIKDNYDFMDKDIDYLKTSFLLVDADQTENQFERCRKIIEALSIYPYYPYFNEKDFFNAYQKCEYSKWTLEKNNLDIPLLAELPTLIHEIEPQNDRENLVDRINESILNKYNNPFFELEKIEFFKACRRTDSIFVDKELFPVVEKILKSINEESYPELKTFILFRKLSLYMNLCIMYGLEDDESEENDKSKEMGDMASEIYKNNKEIQYIMKSLPIDEILSKHKKGF